MAEKLGQLIKEAEKTLGREPLPPPDPSRTYTFEELKEYYKIVCARSSMRNVRNKLKECTFR